MSVKQNEQATIRLTTGEVDPKTKVAVPTSGCIPYQKKISGKFTSGGVNVLGDGNTDFEAELFRGDFLYSASLNELRRIKAVTGLLMELEYSFSADIAVAEDVYTVKSTVYKSIITKNVGASAALVQEVTLPSGELDIRDFDLGAAAFTYNAQTSTLMFELSR